MTAELQWATRHIIVACTSDKRWFDLDAVRTPLTQPDPVYRSPVDSRKNTKAANTRTGWTGDEMVITQNPAGAPPLDWCEDDAETVTQRLIAMMCPQRVCQTCGEPSRRIVGDAEYVQSRSGGSPATLHMRDGERAAEGVNQWSANGATKGDASVIRKAPTLGWTDCGHDNWRAGRVYDPFTEPGDHDMTARLLIGDARTRIKEIPDGSVDFICSSPPFWGLRSYGKDKTAEMGSEPNPAAFIDGLLNLTAEFRRVLAPHGSIAIELGDSYFGSGGAGGDYSNEDGLRAGQPTFKQARSDVLLPKSLCLIPGAYAMSLAYGYNVLNRHAPDSPAGRWRVRNVIVWARPNPPVGALGDKVRPATSYITIACTSDKRFFDLDAVRGPGSENTHARLAKGIEWRPRTAKTPPDGNRASMGEVETAGAPPLDWCEDDDPTGHATLILPTHPYPGAHYATWPPTLAKRLIEMMCPMRVCVVCGEPSRRIVDHERMLNGRPTDLPSFPLRAHDSVKSHNSWGTYVNTLGWTDCGHDTWRKGHVLDPFAGSGTTLDVAVGNGRDATGIELYQANADLIADRLGMFLEVVGPDAA